MKVVKRVKSAPRDAPPLVPVVLAGGDGRRLWPLSRPSLTKPFHALTGELTLLQQTLVRAARVTDRPAVLVVNDAHRFVTAEQCRAAGIAWQCIALEREGRGTAAAIALGARLALARHPDARLLVLPADHLIEDAAGFAASVALAGAHAAAHPGALITFGIAPRRPETGYGYVQAAAGSGPGRGPAVAPVSAFVEKPDRATAQAFATSGRHFWNSGMFLFDARAVLDEIQAHCPRLAETVTAAVAGGSRDLEFFRPGPAYRDCPTGSFDRLVMEKTARAFVVPAAFDWTDVGGWRALAEAPPHDARGNRIRGDVLAVDVRDTLVYAGSRLVAAVGVAGLAIVETDDAVLVADLGRAEELGALVERLRAAGRDEPYRHSREFRPWGSFERIDAGQRHLVKRLRVKPGAGISLQRHRHRSEHWVVVRGVAEVQRAGETFILRENESAYIPAGAVHRLRNPGPDELEVVEVQVGDTLSEDDIERLEDDYGRVPR